VKLERRSLSRLAVPLRALADRFAFGVLILLSLGLLILGKADIRLFEAVNTRIGDLLVPVLSVASEPVAASRRMVDTIGGLMALRQENERLRDQNRRLLEWQSAARRLMSENVALRQMLRLEPGESPPIAVTARVVADAGGPFVHTVLVDVGSAHGVVESMAAVNERGLVGRVIEVGRRSARVLLLTDLNSRIPVMVEPSRNQAILQGDNSRRPRLTFLPINRYVSVGDRVVTSGRGGQLPPGLTVGKVRSIVDETTIVEPTVDWDRLEYLSLLQYAPVLPPEALADLQREIQGPPLPPGFLPPPERAAPPNGHGTAPGARGGPALPDPGTEGAGDRLP
jgi:rod shape-determining protein MreC